jgi:hypothetical protein
MLLKGQPLHSFATLKQLGYGAGDWHCCRIPFPMTRRGALLAYAL